MTKEELKRKIEIKDEMLQGILQGEFGGIVEPYLSYVDPLYGADLNDSVEVCTTDINISKVYQKIKPGSDIYIGPNTLIKHAENTPNQLYINYGAEGSDEIGLFYHVIDKVLNRGLKNIMSILFVSDINSPSYSVLWIPKGFAGGMPPNVYIKYYLTSGVGFSEEFQGKEKILTTKLTKGMYKIWKENIDEIEEKINEETKKLLKNINKSKDEKTI